MCTAKKGDWVQVHEVILKPEARAPHLPEDTRKVPFEMWVKGFLNHDCSIGDVAEITTVTGRVVNGELTEINPGYSHGFGTCVPEILTVGLSLKRMLEEDE